MTKFSASMTRSKWSLMVREPPPVNCKTLLTPILSDGRQAREVAKDIGDKVQVVIDGARGLSSQRLNPYNTYSFRHPESKSSGTGIKFGHSTDCQRNRRDQVFVSC